jgi:hypothetical protein
MRLRVIVFALVAIAVAVGLVLPSAGAKPPKPVKVKAGQSFSEACPSGYTALGGTVEWYNKDGQLVGTSPGTVVGTSTVMFGPAPKGTTTAVVTELNCQAPPTTTTAEPTTTSSTTTTTVAPTTTTAEPTTTSSTTTTTVAPTTTTLPPDLNVYLTGTAPVTDQGLILYGEGIFTGLPIPGGDPDVVRDCPAGYTMDFEQSTFTETGGTDILTPELNTDYGTPIIIITNSTLTEGEPTTATLEYSIACVPPA